MKTSGKRGLLFLDTRSAISDSRGSVDATPSTIEAQMVGRPHWLDDCYATQATTQGHPAALAAAYQAHGNRCLELLSGEFALVLHDRESGSVMAATDRMGRYPVYFQADEQHLRISTNICDLQHTADTTPNPQGLYNYIYFHMIPAPGSFSKEIRKLRMAERLTWQRQSPIIERYWLPRFDGSRATPTAALSRQLRNEVRTAVSSRIADPTTTGAFLSGGLDSSTVAGMLADCLGSEAQAFAIGFDAKGYDEMEYARITARHFGIKLHEYYVTPGDIVTALPELVASFGEPFGNSSALPAWFCARMAREAGIHHLLAGDGGDELFAGNERYAKQAVFEHYGKLPAGLRHSVIEPLAKALPQNLPLTGKIRSYIAQANIPLPDRLHTYNFLHRHDPSELFRPEFLADVDTQEPLRLLGETYQAPTSASTLDRMLYLDWQFTLADNDLRKVRQACDHVGVDVSFPMLDDRLVDLSLEVPDRLKLKGGRLRHFYKESLRGWLPQATIDKTKHGFGLPFGVWMQNHVPLKELAMDNLLDLKERPWFNPDFIDHAIKLHRNGHASYYGELIWILMVLELWLKARDQQPTAVPATGTAT